MIKTEHMVEETTLYSKCLEMKDILQTYVNRPDVLDGKWIEKSCQRYQAIRLELLSHLDLKSKAPSWLTRARKLADIILEFEGHEYGYNNSSIEFSIHQDLQKLLEYLELPFLSPNHWTTTDTLSSLNSDEVNGLWRKSYERRMSDPEGAITASKSLLESGLKTILNEEGIVFASNADLKVLWKLCAKQLNLAPSQHSEEVFKSILGGCETIVNMLASIRNKIGDAHATGKRPVKPKVRHANLAVNLAGSMASFIIETWEPKNKIPF